MIQHEMNLTMKLRTSLDREVSRNDHERLDITRSYTMNECTTVTCDIDAHRLSAWCSRTPYIGEQGWKTSSTGAFSTDLVETAKQGCKLSKWSNFFNWNSLQRCASLIEALDVGNHPRCASLIEALDDGLLDLVDFFNSSNKNAKNNNSTKTRMVKTAMQGFNWLNAVDILKALFKLDQEYKTKTLLQRDVQEAKDFFE